MKPLKIGIDPDIEKNGIAVINTETKTLELQTLGFFDTIKFLIKRREQISVVVIEASWLIAKSSWHGSKTQNTASKIGRDVGLNHGTGICLLDMIKGLGIATKQQKPLKRIWGKDGKQKISHAELQKLGAFSKLNHSIKRTNQEQRDAMLLII